ncbi:hypothetical protein ACN47E_008919 [Coniothyrium glycines]
MSTNSKSLVCQHCSRSFARTEHLDRHVRTHTKEKPFACTHCSQQFARSDLLRRHVLLYHPDSDNPVMDPANEGRGDEQRMYKRQRTRNACDNCNAKKLKCDSTRPCKRCRTKGISCSFSADRSFNKSTGGNDSLFLPSSTTALDAPAHPVTTSAPGSGCVLESTSSHCSPSAPLPIEPQHQPGVTSRNAATSVARDGFGNDEALAVTENMDSLCGLFPMGDVPDVNFDAFSFDWTDLYSLNAGGFGLQDAFDIDFSSLAASNHAMLSPLDTQSSLQDTSASASHKPRTLNAFQTFRNLTDIIFSRPGSPDVIQANDHWFSDHNSDDASGALTTDQDILNHFLWLFTEHVAGWFSIFRNQVLHITATTRSEWYLLMASVGGLFSRQRGANRLAQTLYHVGRQSVLSFACTRPSQKFTAREGVSLIESFILLQLFGYLCGDKRIYEYTEITHKHMLQTALDLQIDYPSSGLEEKKRRDLREAMLIMDCYRVVILQRPPSVPSRCVFELVGSTGSPANLPPDRLPELISAILSKAPLLDFPKDNSESLTSLAYLSLMTWSLVPQMTDSSPHVVQSPWSNNFYESALHHWRISHVRSADENVWVLFHAIHLNTVVCLPNLQSLVVKYLTAQRKFRGESQVLSTDARRCEGLDMNAINRLFKTHLEREKAVWHARKILSLSQYISRAPSPSNTVQDRASPDTCYGIEYPRKAPHFSHCLCFSVLALWCESLLANGLDVQVSRRWLEIGIGLLADDGHGRSSIEAQFQGILVDLHKCALEV